MEDPKLSKLDRIKQFVKDNEGPIAFGVGIACGSMLVAKYPRFYLKPEALYNPARPIPDLPLSEEDIKRDLASGIMVAEFLKEQELVKELTTFGAQWWEEIRNLPKPVTPVPGHTLLSRLKLEF